MVRALDLFVRERRLVKVLPLAALKQSVVGIDAEYFLEQIIRSHKDPMAPAIGGLPTKFESSIDSFLSVLKAENITPLFVLKGLDVVSSRKPFSEVDATEQKRNEAWDVYNRRLSSEIVKSFSALDSIPVSETTRLFEKTLSDRGIEYITAPYLPWPQLVYLLNHSNHYVDAIYGPEEVLLYDVERYVSNIDVTAGTFSWVTKRSILSDLGNITNEQFVDICILAGTRTNPTFPILESKQYGGHQILRTARELLRNYVSGYGAVNAYADNNLVRSSDYVEVYKRAWSAIKYHVILTDRGAAEPISFDEPPSDIHDFMSQRLPDELYFYLSKGIVGSEILNVLTSGKLIETPPLDGGQLLEYRKFLSLLEGVRCHILNLLTQPLHRFYQAKRVSAVYWFEKNVEHELPHRLTPPLYTTISTWGVSQRLVDPKLKDLKTGITIDTAVVSLLDKSFVAQSFSERSQQPFNERTQESQLTTTDEILINVFFRFLQLREFVDTKHELTGWGNALAAGLEASSIDDLFGAPLTIILELIRWKYLNNSDFSYTGPERQVSEEDRRHVNLITRVASLLNLAHNSTGFKGTLSRNLLAFNSFVAKYTETARSLLEVTTFSLLANDDADRLVIDNWSSLGVTLPFATVASGGLGIAVKTYLEEVSVASDPTSNEEHKRAREYIKNEIEHAADVISDLERSFRLWDAVVESVRVGAKQGVISSTDAAQFLAADEWLQKRR
ncbi:temperature dependent protein affecting M2 dsRNA replication-domain-containing protein [Lipomyces japonicus]|uniref:temperature dependent protein affecting M2 dsRNA replication-domain-containing protein n=1 Tax=Lipomyces japonicus TaxID=56871 RepID=UPI0034CF9B38